VSTTIGRRAPPSPSVAVGANQQVIVRRNGDLAPIRNVNGEVETAWTAGQLIFEDESVANVVRRFNSYNHKQIRVLDDALASRRIRGVFRASDPDAFVLFLKSAAAVSATRTDGDTILVGAAGIQDDALP
jgi:ferric-dicitrate binding protein FerR (iron transport regulator)